MSHKHLKFGKYYGVLTKVDAESELIYGARGLGESQNLYEDMLMTGVKEIFLDIKDEEDYSFTMFFSTDEGTDFKSLMIIVTNLRPDEFTQFEEHHFRMWFD
jgi:hypothetical protein